MASILFGGGITDARGSVSGMTFSRTRGGAIVKSKPVPLSKSSPLSSISRGRLSSLSKQWGAVLTSSERANWNSFALLHPTTNKFGQTIYLSGHQMYIRCNANINLVGGTEITSPPADLNVSNITLMVNSIQTTPALSTLVTLSASVADEVVYIWSSAPVSPGRYVIDYMLKGMMVGASGSNDFTTEYGDVFGFTPIHAGMKIGVAGMVVNEVTGARSPLYSSFGIVT